MPERGWDIGRAARIAGVVSFAIALTAAVALSAVMIVLRPQAPATRVVGRSASAQVAATPATSAVDTGPAAFAPRAAATTVTPERVVATYYSGLMSGDVLLAGSQLGGRAAETFDPETYAGAPSKVSTFTVVASSNRGPEASVTVAETLSGAGGTSRSRATFALRLSQAGWRIVEIVYAD
jgi:hypothetical protein